MFYDPKGGICRGHEEIDRIAGMIKAMHPDFGYRLLSPPEQIGDAQTVGNQGQVFDAIGHVRHQSVNDRE